jgi:DNA-binding transcriptional LysR family regulator
MSDTLALFGTFVRTVEAGSFSAVARELHTTQPTVSRQIAALEAHLGCLLFQRTTRSLTLTDDGRTFYEHARRTLETAEEAQQAVGRRRGTPSGVLRLACAGVFGRLHVIPRLLRLRARHPELHIALSMGDAFVDLVAEGLDLAIRIGETGDKSLVARRIGITRRVVVATPDYLARRGTPRHPDDLAAHDCVVYDRLLTGASWTFDSPAGPLVVPVQGPVHVNNTEAVRAAVLQGLGIGYVPVWHFAEQEIESGRLVVVLREFELPPPQPIHAVYPTRRFLAPKVRVAIDYFADEFALDPALRIAAI